MRMFSGSEDYEESGCKHCSELHERMIDLSKTTKDVWVVQYLHNKFVVAVLDHSVKLDEVVKKYSLNIYMHTRRRIES